MKSCDENECDINKSRDTRSRDACHVIKEQGTIYPQFFIDLIHIFSGELFMGGSPVQPSAHEDEDYEHRDDEPQDEQTHD